MLRLPPCGNANDTDDKLHNDHPSGAGNQQLATTESLHGVERDGCRADVDEGSDQGNEEWVADRAQTGEEYCSEIEDEINSRQLLHGLHKDTLV